MSTYDFDAMVETDSVLIQSVRENHPNITIEEIYLHPAMRVRTIADLYNGEVEIQGFVTAGEGFLDGAYYARIATESGKIHVRIEDRRIYIDPERGVDIQPPNECEFLKIVWNRGYYKNIFYKYLFG